MEYVIQLLQRDLNKELIALEVAKDLTKGKGFSMDRVTMDACDESKRLAEERIPQLKQALKKISK